MIQVNPQSGGGGGGATTTLLVALEDLTLGDLIAITPQGRATLASSPMAAGKYLPRGIAKTSVSAGSLGEFYTLEGMVVPVRMIAVPGATQNGQIVYLSETAGKATETAPGPGNAVVEVGSLVGANGITDVPAILFSPQWVTARPPV